MAETPVDDRTATLGVLTAVSNALVALHKEQFGRGATRARTEFAGPDAVATADEFIAAVGEIVRRKVRASAGSVDAGGDVVFENFIVEPRDGAPPTAG